MSVAYRGAEVPATRCSEKYAVAEVLVSQEHDAPNTWTSKNGSMKKSVALVIAFVLLFGIPALAQHHMGNWVHRTATDTTFVLCWTDSLTWTAFPPNSMSMMMSDSIYCWIDRMNMDSLYFPHDSTFIGWCRVQAGRDSMHFDMMNGDSAYGHHNMMQFMKNLIC